MSAAAQLPAETCILVVPNDRGNFGLQVAGDSEVFGNFPTTIDAVRHADPTFKNVVITEEAKALEAH